MAKRPRLDPANVDKLKDLGTYEEDQGPSLYNPPSYSRPRQGAVPISPGGTMKSSDRPEYRKGGAVKAGAPRVSAPCTDTKVCKK